MPGPVLADVAANGAIPAEIPAIVEPTLTPIPETVAAPPLVEETIEEVVPTEFEKRPFLFGEGVASYYGAELAGNRTANGERFNPSALTAAHRTLPMGTRLRVTNKANGKSVVVRINDRGPFTKNRIIDVSRAAAEKISMIGSGTARVTLEHVS
ncbi:MAG: septal ring lytic transglycosylase RlpA family protein [Sphingosinicella sp.]|nr:septal ring lytic transglycosylase RlpA family protein [Sphingosinicella sp.]